MDLFATSGGAVNALALVARHPEQVHTLVAHEPWVTFTSHHGGFLGGEYGQRGDPGGFAATLGEALASSS